MFLQLVEFQLTLAHSLTPSHAQGWSELVSCRHVRTHSNIYALMAEQQVEIEQTSSESHCTSRGANLGFLGGVRSRERVFIRGRGRLL